MSKYIDLEPRIREFYGTELGTARRAGMCDALRYLDNHPDQVPGRTITVGELDELLLPYDQGLIGSDTLAKTLGITTVPDPEPTNAEKLESEIARTFSAGESPLSRSDMRDLARRLDNRGVTVGDES